MYQIMVAVLMVFFNLKNIFKPQDELISNIGQKRKGKEPPGVNFKTNVFNIFIMTFYVLKIQNFIEDSQTFIFISCYSMV